MALENGGFELGYRPDFDQYGNKPVHTACVFEVDVTGGPITKRYTVERGEIHNPAGWWSWYAHQRNNSPVPWDPNNTLGWCEPEIRVSDPTHARHRSGSHAGYLFTYRRIHEGGLFQQVQVTPGARYRFTAFGHAWISNDDSQPPSCSLPGCGALAYPVGAAGLNDDQRSVRLYVGIDPLGGNNPYSQSVVWSDGWHIFNAYRDEPLSVEAVAQNDTITVYLLSSTLWPVIHNDVAWDDCALVEVTAAPSPCRGTPRVQYARVVNVLPPTVTPERAAAVFSSCWAQGRQTVTGSYDDAGIGDLDERKAVLWDIPQADEGVFVGWYAEHYPGVVVEFAGHAEGDPLRLTYPTTYHPPTITSPYGPRGTGFHYGLDLRSSWNLWQSEALAAHDGEIILAGVEPGREYFGTQVQVRALTARGEIITRYAHLVAADNGGVYVKVGQRVLAGTPLGRCDNTGTSTGDHLHFDVRLNGAYTDPEPLIDFPNVPPEPPDNEGQLLSLHIQTLEPGALDFLRQSQPTGVKIVSEIGAIQAVSDAAPEALLVYRHHLTREDELACLADPVNRARWFIDQFYEQIAPLVDAARVDYVETAINETMDGDKVPAAIAFEHAFIDELARRIPEALPLVATIAVGNPHESQFPLLVPLASHVIQHGGAFGYHAYWPVDHGRSYLVEQWPWHAGRFEAMDAVIRDALGYGVPWLLSECGACGWDAATNAYDPAAGWKHPACFAGNWQDYKRDLLQFAGLLKVSPARVLGSTLFTVCPPSWEWDYFTLDAAQLAELADALEA